VILGQTIGVNARFRLGAGLVDGTPSKLAVAARRPFPFFAEGSSRANGVIFVALSMDLDNGWLSLSLCVDEGDAGEQQNGECEYHLPLMGPRPPFAWRPSEHGHRGAVESHQVLWKVSGEGRMERDARPLRVFD
jgi:hypothetical protein